MARPIYLRPAPQQVAQPGPLLSPAVRVPVLPTHVGQHQPVQQPVKVQQISQPQVTTVYRPTGQLKSSARAPVKVSRPSSLPRAPSAATLPASQAPAAETSPSPPSGSSEQPEILVEGQVTNIGRICLQVGAPIGEGAYAKVFAARLVDSPSGDEDVAIKEMLCGEGPGILPDASVQRATFEVQSMQRLAALFDGESAPLGSLMHAPRVLDHQFWHLGPSENGSGDGAFLCRIAMTRFPGQPLVAFLEEFEAAAASSSSHRLVRRSAASTSSYSEGTEEDAQAYCASFVRAALAVRELLAQVGPTLAKLNSDIAIHRDVNARNILIHVSENGNLDASDGSTSCSGVDVCMAPNSGQLHFMLVDFGSSTDRAAWHCGGGPGSWLQRLVARHSAGELSSAEFFRGLARLAMPVAPRGSCNPASIATNSCGNVDTGDVAFSGCNVDFGVGSPPVESNIIDNAARDVPCRAGGTSIVGDGSVASGARGHDFAWQQQLAPPSTSQPSPQASSSLQAVAAKPQIQTPQIGSRLEGGITFTSGCAGVAAHGMPRGIGQVLSADEAAALLRGAGNEATMNLSNSSAERLLPSPFARSASTWATEVPLLRSTPGSTARLSGHSCLQQGFSVAYGGEPDFCGDGEGHASVESARHWPITAVSMERSSVASASPLEMPPVLPYSQSSMDVSNSRYPCGDAWASCSSQRSSNSQASVAMVAAFSQRSLNWEHKREQRREAMRRERSVQEVAECSFQPALITRRRHRSTEAERTRGGRLASSASSPNLPVSLRLSAGATAAQASKVAEAARVQAQREEQIRQECTFAPDLSKSASSLRLSLRGSANASAIVESGSSGSAYSDCEGWSSAASSRSRSPSSGLHGTGGTGAPSRRRGCRARPREGSADNRGQHSRTHCRHITGSTGERITGSQLRDRQKLASALGSDTADKGRNTRETPKPAATPQTNPVAPHMVTATEYLRKDVFARLSEPQQDFQLSQTIAGSVGSSSVVSSVHGAPSSVRDSVGSSEVSDATLLRFWRRQNEREEMRLRRLRELEASTAPRGHPTLHGPNLPAPARTRRLAERHRARSPGVTASSNNSRLEPGEEECSFQPAINPASARRPSRGVRDMSVGDARRREARAAELRSEVENSASREATFTPQLRRTPSAYSELTRPSVLDPDDYLKRTADRRSAELARCEKEAQSRHDEILAECTFCPKVNASAPTFVRRMAESYRAVRELQEKEFVLQGICAGAPVRPEWR